MPRNLNIYFYKVEPRFDNSEYHNTQELLKNAFSFPNDIEYNSVHQKGGTVDLFGNRQTNDNIVFGTFTFIQTENIPPKQNLITKATEDLDLTDEEGLGYQTSFLFDKNTNIIVIVNRRPGVNISSVVKFVQNNFDLPVFRLSQVIKPSALTSFLNAPNYKKLKVKIANPSDISSLIDANNSSLKEILDANETLNSGEVSFEFKADKDESLTNTAVRNIVRFLQRNNETELKELKVWGDDGDNPNHLYDFITDRLKDFITVEVQRLGNFRIAEVYRQLREKYDEHRHMLIEVYSNRDE